MRRQKITIGQKDYMVDLAVTEEDKRKGLQDVDHLAPDCGMLFVWEDEGDRRMWMKDTKIPLDQIFINGDYEVIYVHTGVPMSKALIEVPDCQFVLEVNAGSGIVTGDDLYYDEEDDLTKYNMRVLLKDGKTQFLLQGGERIVSRKETKVLIKKAKKAYRDYCDEQKYNKDCRDLGRYMFRVLKGQDNREPEYV